MGEVYRADDLKLGQVVALKFLPRRLSKDEALLERFHAEVRNARQVAHPHVCRVYDIGEAGEVHFISMEFVDGEDLSTLLHRIGRLPPGKAVEVARQLCAGLAAAHDRGVLHRDLKPANVMLDGHGRARITDFGLAVRAEEAGDAMLAGTPAYMAPEQLAGGSATAQSDLYALGLVLYEVFTGKRAFEAASFAEWQRKHAEDQPAPPSLHVGDMDPAVERLILRCLEKDPAKRPRSAAQMALALPGGDPLAAAIAAGETPSPEMVAAAGGEGALLPRTAWILLGGILVLAAACVALAPLSTDMGLAPWEKSPAGLRDRARQIVARLGYEPSPADSAYWLSRDSRVIHYLADTLPGPVWRRIIRELGLPILFHYRQSPRPLVTIAPGGKVSPDDPALEVSGMVYLVTDSQGHLRSFRAVPPEVESAPPDAPKVFDWAPVFAEAGLDFGAFRSAEPRWIPSEPFDVRAEWTGSIPELPETPLTVSAGAFRGKLVQFQVLGPWSRPERMSSPSRDVAQRMGNATLAAGLLAMLLTSIYFARRNLRQGRGDRAGARRLGIFVFSLAALHHFLSGRLVGDLLTWLFGSFVPGMGVALVDGASLYVIYLALEPYVRRRMPELLIGWARLLEGRFRDPRVGRDVLIGVLFGAAGALAYHVVDGASAWLPFAGQTTTPPFGLFEFGGGNPLLYLLRVNLSALEPGVGTVAWYFLLSVLLRRRSLAVAALGILLFVVNLEGENAALDISFAFIFAALTVVAIVRFGLLVNVVSGYSFFLLGRLPASLDLSSWYGMFALPGAMLLAAITLYGFRISVGNQPLLAGGLDD
jgi:Protein kinase domain